MFWHTLFSRKQYESCLRTPPHPQHAGAVLSWKLTLGQVNRIPSAIILETPGIYGCILGPRCCVLPLPDGHIRFNIHWSLQGLSTSFSRVRRPEDDGFSNLHLLRVLLIFSQHLAKALPQTRTFSPISHLPFPNRGRVHRCSTLAGQSDSIIE